MRLRARVIHREYAKPVQMPVPLPAPSPGAPLLTALAITFWALVGAIGAACVSIGTLLLWAWAGTQRSWHLEPDILVAIGLITGGGMVLVRFAGAAIRDLLRPRQ
jgi:hypothetical protein